MRWVVAVVLAFAALLAACGGEAPDDGRLHVVAGFAPLAEVAERVGGADVDVEDLTPAGAEPHDLELDTDAVDAVEDADLVLYIGGGFQPAIEEVADRAGDAAIDVRPKASEDDPHLWLDPTKLADIARRVRDALTASRPEAAKAFESNAATYVAELEALDAAFEAGLATCERRTIVTSHGAFGHLTERYHLKQWNIAGLSPEAEPNPAALGELADEVVEEGVTTVFTEPLVASDIAETVAREADISTAVLDPIEGLADGATYDSVMRKNLTALRTALGCT